MPPDTKARGYFARRSRFKWWEGLPWVLAVAAFFVLPAYMAFGTQVLITIIFAHNHFQPEITGNPLALIRLLIPTSFP